MSALRLGLLVLVLGLSTLPIPHEPAGEVDNHPEVVLITAHRPPPTGSAWSCGVLLSPTAVLTVAHGVAEFETWEVMAPSVPSGTAHASGKLLRVHPLYEPGFTIEGVEHDLAVLILDQPISIGRDFPKLPDSPLYPLGTSLVLVGKGMGESQPFREVRVTLEGVWGNRTIYGGWPQAARLGDSGAPVYLNRPEGPLVGLVSRLRVLNSSHMPIDLFVPLGGRNKEWIVEQLRSKQATAAGTPGTEKKLNDKGHR